MAQSTEQYRDDLTEDDRARVTAVTAPTADFSRAEPFEAMQGGAGTSRAIVNRDAFSHFAANIGFEGEEQFNLGNALFRKLWVASPSSTLASDGLGPLFNARGCQNCHLKDGRGRAPEPGEKPVSLFLRLSVPPSTDTQVAALENYLIASVPEPTYGGQLQNFAVPGLAAEGDMDIAYEDQPVTLDDGTIITLRKPSYRVANPANGPLSPDMMISPRVAPQMIGLGLVEQIHPADLLANADPEDTDGDGISGRANWQRLEGGELRIGRFGWKAGTASIRTQSADAFAGDIGISSPDAPHHWGDCTEYQLECLAMASGVQQALGDTEAPPPVLDLVTFYSQNLAVPVRRNVDAPEVLRGKQLFYEAGCAACHTPKFVTRRDAPNDHQQFQLIWPYSDFLLHDMGEGLADHRPEGAADGYEWRTAPLWGIGLTETVSEHTQFLHDGRARNLTEAILWHGGEAERARDAFANFAEADREALLTFLESL